MFFIITFAFKYNLELYCWGMHRPTKDQTHTTKKPCVVLLLSMVLKQNSRIAVLFNMYLYI